jgi:hypothetical protein
MSVTTTPVGRANPKMSNPTGTHWILRPYKEVLGLERAKAIGIEAATHIMPHDADKDNTVRSDLFALGSTLYELEHGAVPFAGLDDEIVTQHFAQGVFPSVLTMKLGHLISGAWEGKFSSATEMLEFGKEVFATNVEKEDNSQDIVDCMPGFDVMSRNLRHDRGSRRLPII